MVGTPEKLVKDFPQRKKRAAPEATPGKRAKRTASIDGSKLSVSQSQAFDERVSSESQTLLHEFDLDIKYGPCCGITRTERFERAVKLGLNPPDQIKHLLMSLKEAAKPRNKKELTAERSIWEGRV